MYVCVCIYIEREREREREIHTWQYAWLISDWVHF